jgi:stalled ribosome rescue protein Dom34
MPSHLAIWIDHKEAHVFHIHQDQTAETTITAPLKHTHHKHPKGAAQVKEHPDDAKRFFHEVARSLDGTDGILIVGPSTAKLEFSRYLHKHEVALEARVVGIETVDHPSDGQIVAYAKKYFQRSDRFR